MISSFDSFAALLDKNVKEEGNQRIISKIRTDKAWRREFCIHVSTIVKSFVDGAIDSQPLSENGFKLPSKLDLVSNWVAFMLNREFEKQPVISISVANAVSLVRQWSSDHPEFQKWALDKDALFTNMAMRLMGDALTLENEKLQCRQKESQRDQAKV